MTNPYYNPSGVPATRAQLSSSAMRTELVAIAAGCDKLVPTLTANALLHINAAGTQYAANVVVTLSAAGALAGITDLTTTGNTVLGNASTDTLNVGAGGIVKDASGNFGTNTAVFGASNTAGLSSEPYAGGTVVNIGHTGGAAGGDSYLNLRRLGTVLGSIFQDSSTGIGINSLGQMRLQTGGTDRVVIDGSGNMSIANTGAAPAAPASGGVLYILAGALVYRGSSGTITTIAPA